MKFCSNINVYTRNFWKYFKTVVNPKLVLAIVLSVYVWSLLSYLSLQLKVKEDNTCLKMNTQKHIKEKEMNQTYVITICFKRNGTKSLGDNPDRQIEQAFVLLKSAALLTRSKLRFVIIVDDNYIFKNLIEKLKQWPEHIRSRLILDKRKTWFPPKENFREMFRPCATERLFLLEVLPHEDSVIFLDTDIVFLKSPEDLWEQFYKFNSSQMSAMVPCLFHYQPEIGIPYYGKTGLNAGLWMMNLTRMRTFPGGWTNTCSEVVDKYRKKIKLADQDIANIIFSEHPEFLHELECQWNFRDFLCWMGENECEEAESTGIYLLHGNALTFYTDHNQKFKALYKEFLSFDVERPLEELLQSIKSSLKNIVYRVNGSKCENMPLIDEMLTKSLENSIHSCQ